MKMPLPDLFNKTDERIIGVRDGVISYLNETAKDNGLNLGQPFVSRKELKKVVEAEDGTSYYIVVDSVRSCELTNLPVGREAVDMWAAGRKVYALLFVDLDGFKLINDQLGHAAGDQVLVAVANGLRSIIRSTDAAIRLGGDEFLVAISQHEDMIQATTQNVAGRIVEFVRTIQTGLSASVGIAFYPEHGSTPSQILLAADYAMYAAKRSGKNGVSVASDHFSLQALKRALENQEFFLVYQPQMRFDAASKTWVAFGVEALIRWRHPVFGVIPPGQFIHLIETSPNLCREIHIWLIHEVVDQVKKWTQHHFNLKVSFNLSALAVVSDLIDSLIEMTTGIASQFQIELTETVASGPIVVESLDLARKAGIHVALDDFGQGYSGLTTVVALEPDMIKLDRHNSMSENFVKMATLVASTINAQILAEGVETKQQSELLLESGITHQQGYFFSWPLWPADVEKFLTSKQPSN